MGPIAARHSAPKCRSAKLVTISALYLRDTALASVGYGWHLDLMSRGSVPMYLRRELPAYPSRATRPNVGHDV